MPRSSTPAFASPRPTHEDIARRAYDIFVSSGSIHGNDVQHWLEAEQSLTMVGSAATEPSVVADAPARARATRVVTAPPTSDGEIPSALGRAPARRRRKGEAVPPKSA